jgi:hypothetical protein
MLLVHLVELDSEAHETDHSAPMLTLLSSTSTN